MNYYILTPQGFMSRNGGYTSAIADAKVWTYEEAIALCRKRAGNPEGWTYPISVEVAAQVHKK